jgi:hypothetical protein
LPKRNPMNGGEGWSAFGVLHSFCGLAPPADVRTVAPAGAEWTAAELATRPRQYRTHHIGPQDIVTRHSATTTRPPAERLSHSCRLHAARTKVMGKSWASRRQIHPLPPSPSRRNTCLFAELGRPF